MPVRPCLSCKPITVFASYESVVCHRRIFLQHATIGISKLIHRIRISEKVLLLVTQIVICIYCVQWRECNMFIRSRYINVMSQWCEMFKCKCGPLCVWNSIMWTFFKLKKCRLFLYVKFKKKGFLCTKFQNVDFNFEC